MKIKFKADKKEELLMLIFMDHDQISSQKMLADFIGIAEETLSRVLKARQNVSMYVAKKLAYLGNGKEVSYYFDIVIESD